MTSYLRFPCARIPAVIMDDPRPRQIAREMNSEQPGLFERSGQHAIRKVAVLWCREHPVAAAELPGWNLELLKSVLAGVA